MRKRERRMLGELKQRHHADPAGLIIACTHLVLKRLEQTQTLLERVMTKLDDVKSENAALKQAVKDLITQDNTNTDALKALIGKQGGATDDDLQGIITDSQSTRADIAAALLRDAPDAAPIVQPPDDGGTDPVAGGDTGTGDTGATPAAGT